MVFSSRLHPTPVHRQAKQDATALQEEGKAVKAQLKEAEAKEKELADAARGSIVPIGNLVHDSVPVSNDEANNVIVKTWGVKRPEEKLYNHVDLVQLLDLVDLEAGSSVAGTEGGLTHGEGFSIVVGLSMRSCLVVLVVALLCW